MRNRRHRRLLLHEALLLACFVCAASSATAQLGEGCVVSILNRTVEVQVDGSWAIPNVPANFGPIRARATCVDGGVTRAGQSDFFVIGADTDVEVPPVSFDEFLPIPSTIEIGPSAATLATLGATLQLAVVAHFSDGSTQDVTGSVAGTAFVSSNSQVATVEVTLEV